MAELDTGIVVADHLFRAHRRASPKAASKDRDIVVLAELMQAVAEQAEQRRPAAERACPASCPK
jgi:hypothetical protein